MATKKIYVGSLGPYLYEDDDAIADQDGDFEDELRRALATDGQMYIGSEPTSDEEVMRLGDANKRILSPLPVADIDDPSTELSGKSGVPGTLILVYQIDAGRDEATLYTWETANSEGADIPYIIAGSSGFWVATAGKYSYTAVRNIIFPVKEENTSAITKGQVLAITGSSGVKIEVGLCDCDDADKIRTLGLACDDISQNGIGNITYRGIIEKVDTRSTNTDINPNEETWLAGDLLWVSRTPGGMTNVRPTSGRSIKAARTVKGSSSTDTLIVIGLANPIWIAAADGEDIVQRMGDNDGANKISFRDYANNEVGYIDSNGDADLNLLVDTLDTATYDDVQDWLNNVQSAGIIDGCVLNQDRAAGELDMTAGKGFIKTTDSEIGSTLSFDIDAHENLTLTQDVVNYIYIDYNAGTPTLKAETTRSNIEWNRMFTVGRAFTDGVTLHILNSGLHVSNLARTGHERLIAVHGFENASGAVVSETGTLNLLVTAGIWYLGHNEVLTDALDTTPVTGLDTFTYMHYGTDSWITDNAAATAIDCTHYNDGDDVLGELTAQKYGVQWVYIEYDSHLFIIYDTINGTLAAAEAAEAPTSLPSVITGMGELIAKIIVKQTGVIVSIQNINITGATFTGSGVPNHNDLGGLQGGTADEYYHLLAAEYTELSEWLDDVTLGSDGLTTVPEIVLTPAAEALSDVVGGMYFSNVDTGVYVCTSL